MCDYIYIYIYIVLLKLFIIIVIVNEENYALQKKQKKKNFEIALIFWTKQLENYKIYKLNYSKLYLHN